jgi:hypothetical protein
MALFASDLSAIVNATFEMAAAMTIVVNADCAGLLPNVVNAVQIAPTVICKKPNRPAADPTRRGSMLIVLASATGFMMPVPHAKTITPATMR